MGKLKVAINGFGRIGRNIFRQYLLGDYPFEIVAINDPGDLKGSAHLLKFDSSHGILDKEIHINDKNNLVVDGKEYFFSFERSPSKIDWNKGRVDLVIDATGIFKDNSSLGEHIKGSVKKVIITSPADVDKTIVMGVNDDSYDKDTHHIVSNASCTTNCLAPVIKAIDEHYGVIGGLVTTVHSYTADQRLVDGEHSDLRRARAAAQSMIPTTTGAAKAVGLVLPHLAGKLDGMAIRVPTLNVSVVDVVLSLARIDTAENINQVLKNAASRNLAGILAVEDRPLVSVDFNGNKNSSIVDLMSTKVLGSQVKILSWYDNESGYSARVLDLAKLMILKM